ncbi:MAG: nucleotidyltransferase domain-containing protein [bacterium]
MSEDSAQASGSVVDESIVTAVQNYLRLVLEHGIRVHFGVLFGSYATGEANEWSDIDLIVVSPHFDGIRDRKDSNLLWRLAARSDSRIEPIPCGERQWEEDDSSAIIEIARREGMRIPVPGA